MASLPNSITFKSDPSAFAAEIDKWWFKDPESMEAFKNLQLGTQAAFQYSGFDAVSMFNEHGNRIAANIKQYVNLCVLVTTRGVNREKFMNKMSTEGLAMLNEITSTFALDWTSKGANIGRTTLTPGRLVLLSPELSGHSMKYVTMGVTSHFPYPYRTQAIAALIPDGNVTMMEAAYMASYYLTTTTSPNMPKRNAFNNTLVYVNAGKATRLVTNERKIKFWSNVKRSQKPGEWDKMKADILKMARDFAEIRQQNSSSAPILDEVIDFQPAEIKLPTSELINM